MSVISDRSAESRAAEPKDGFTLSDRVPASTTDQEVSITLDSDATVERLSIRIYPGAELDLQLVPVVRTSGGGSRDRPLLEFAGKEYVDGDDDMYVWELSKPVEEGDEIVMKATNNDGSNAYDYRANFDVDYRAGSTGLLASIGGVL